ALRAYCRRGAQTYRFDGAVTDLIPVTLAGVHSAYDNVAHSFRAVLKRHSGKPFLGRVRALPRGRASRTRRKHASLQLFLLATSPRFATRPGAATLCVIVDTQGRGPLSRKKGFGAAGKAFHGRRGPGHRPRSRPRAGAVAPAMAAVRGAPRWCAGPAHLCGA